MLIQTRSPLNLHLFGTLNNYCKQLQMSKQQHPLFKLVIIFTKMSQMGSSFSMMKGTLFGT